MGKRDASAAGILARLEKKAKKTHGPWKLQAAKKSAAAQKFGTRAERTPEVKFIDTAWAVTHIDNVGEVQLLNGMVEGTTVSERIGQKVEATSVDVNWTVMNADLSGSTNVVGVNTVRVSLVFDRQPNQTAATYANVYTPNTVVETPQGHRLINNTDRFEVLKTEMFTLDTADRLSMCGSWYIPMHHETRFAGSNNGDVTDITTGALYLMYSSDQTTAGNAGPSLNAHARYRFKDM